MKCEVSNLLILGQFSWITHFSVCFFLWLGFLFQELLLSLCLLVFPCLAFNICHFLLNPFFNFCFDFKIFFFLPSLSCKALLAVFVYSCIPSGWVFISKFSCVWYYCFLMSSIIYFIISSSLFWNSLLLCWFHVCVSVCARAQVFFAVLSL